MNKKDIRWEWKEFSQIPSSMLYQLLQLRSAVFIVEQRSIYQDLDGKDQTAVHLLGWVENENKVELAAAARVLLPNNFGILSFGRVVVAPLHRGLGYGERLVAEILDYLKASPYYGESVVISAQHYLVDFYTKFGFKSHGEPYDEDGIMHIKMVK